MAIRRTFLLVLPMLVACSSQEDVGPIDEGLAVEEADSSQSFYAIPKSEVAPAGLRAMALPPAGNQSVYIVINRRELGSKWFLSAFLERFSFGVVGGAGASLGTRVVSLTAQNGQIYFFDAGDTKATSSINDLQYVIDAYPIVDPGAIGQSLRYPKDKWVIIDPGNGKNPLGFVKDYFAGAAFTRFQTTVSHQQGYKPLADGIQFRQVFAGYADMPLQDGTLDPNPFRAHGTVAISLRRYTVGANFKSPPLALKPYFFANGDNALTGSPEINKWNIAPGMKPIKWLISRDILKTQSEANNVYNLVGAVKAGIESWNEAFGFKVVEASLASTSDDLSDDSLNVLYWDVDPSVPFAFADWRSNPNTGEIRGASIYFNSVFFQPDAYVDDSTKSTARKAAAFPRWVSRPAVSSISWGGMRSTPKCSLFAGDVFTSAEVMRLLRNPTKSLTAKQKVERLIAHTAAHELGHTLGLRHNFKASLVPDGEVATSVMDYLVDEDALLRTKPGPYDVAAVKYLYRLSASEPSQAFCTDEDTANDPTCAVFDASDDPLRKYFGPIHSRVIDLEFATKDDTFDSYFEATTSLVGNYVRGGSDADASDAFSILFRRSLSPTTEALSDGAIVDKLSDLALRKLYLEPGDYDYVGGIPRASLAPRILSQLQGVLTNADGVRSYPARRNAVAILRLLQSNEALGALVASRATIESTRGSLTATEALLTDELLARIEAAIKPYFR